MDPATNLDSLYQEIILDHYRNPHHKGLREPFEAEVHHVNPTCGDEITLRVHLGGDPDRRSSPTSRTTPRAARSARPPRPCSPTSSSGSRWTRPSRRTRRSSQLMQGRGNVEPDEDVLEDGIAFAGVAKFPARIKCALLSWMAFKDATVRASKEES